MLSNYVCAGFETLSSITDRFIKSEFFDNHFSRNDISNFFDNNCNKFLHSFGQNFTGKKRYDKYIESEYKLLKKCRDTEFFQNSIFMVDSGGFQASIGRINKDETEKLISLYHEFLEKYYNVFDRAFTLDLPPGPGCKLFSNFDDVYKFNSRTYNLAKNLPNHVREKMVYIHHFRTPRLWDIFTDILKTGDMFNYFNYHATGGIVANMTSDIAIPCIIYILPLIPLINQALKYDREKLNFHILGGANFRDIFFYELIRLHLLNLYGLEVEITYDSSGLFKGLMVGRFIHIIKDDDIYKADLRTNSLNKRFREDEKIIDVYRNSIFNMSSKYNFKRILMQKIYDNNTGTFFEEVRIYSLLYMLYTFGEVQNKLRKLAKEIYPLFTSENYSSFCEEVNKVTKRVNEGKITRKQKAKSSSIINSLNMLTNLDEDYCKYIVSKFLSKDEFIELIDKNREVMKF